MTVASEVNRSGPYTGNGVTVVFDYEFRILDEKHIRVVMVEDEIETILTRVADYAVTGVGESGGGSITMTVAPTAAQTITVLRDVPFTQETDLENQGPYFAETVEAALDLAAMRDQQLSFRVSRALAVSESSEALDLTVPDPEVGKFLRWRSDLTGLENSPDVTFPPNSYPVATQSEAEAGTSNTVLMSPLRTKQAIVKAFTSPVNSIVGMTLLGGRPTLTPGTPITTTDVAAMPAIYYTPYATDRVRVFDGTADQIYQFPELTLNLDGNVSHTGYHQSGKNFDLFIAIDGSGLPYMGTGVAWASDFLRGTGAGTTEIEFWQGLWRNKNSITLRIGPNLGDLVVVPARQATFVGGFRATANGQASDTLLRRFLSSAYYPAPRKMFVNAQALGTSWTYSIFTFRQAAGNTANKVEFLQCLPAGPLKGRAFGTSQNSLGSVLMFTGIGFNSLTINSGKGGLHPIAAANLSTMGESSFDGYAGLGYGYLAWLEAAVASGVTTWLAGDSVINAFTSGLQGEVCN